MNKILVDGDKFLLKDNQEIFEVSGNVKIYINNLEGDINLEFYMSDNSKLEVFDYNSRGKNSSIKVIQNNNSKFNYIHTFKVEDIYKFDYKAIIKGNNNSNNINIYGVSNGDVYMDVDGDVSLHTVGNELNENIKILTENGKAYISPMLHISALDVIANHNTAISKIRKDELFYLMSKGIDEKKSVKLIEDSYVYGILRKYNEEEFYNLIKE